MADQVAILTNNTGNNIYAQAGREFLTNPIKATSLKILVDNDAQISDNIKIRNYRSSGGESNRDISLRRYISATDKNARIIDVVLDPPVILDGQTYFELSIEPGSEVDFLFYFEQAELSELLK
jgi:hypothetical protein